MTHPNQALTHEKPIVQSFADGRIEDLVSPMGHSEVTTPILEAPLRFGDSVLISPDVELPVLGDVLGSPVIAMLELGGFEGNRGEPPIDPELVRIVKVDRGQESDEMRRAMRFAGKDYLNDVGPLFMFAVGRKQMQRFSVIGPNTVRAFLGREANNMKWYAYDGSIMDEDNAKLPNMNPSVSRKQLMVSSFPQGLLVSGESISQSPTSVRTVATAAHRNIIERKRPQVVPASESQPSRSRKNKVTWHVGKAASRSWL